jgi:hypothetical protein
LIDMRIHRMTKLASLALLLACISCTLPPPAPGSFPLSAEEPAPKAAPDAGPPPPCSVRLTVTCAGCTIHSEFQQSCGPDCSRLETVDRNIKCGESVQTCGGPVTCACQNCEAR